MKLILFIFTNLVVPFFCDGHVHKHCKVLDKRNFSKEDKTVKKNIGSLANFDFTYEQDICNPLSIQFFNVSTNPISPYWSFGDGGTNTGNLNPTHKYLNSGTYKVKYSVSIGGIRDTIIKFITVEVTPGNTIITPDTTICLGSNLQLKSIPEALSFCWSPSSFLDDPTSPFPITSTLQNITYYLNSEVTGANIIVNGNFEAGNTGFTSAYYYTSSNTIEAEYFVSTNPQNWNGGLSSCGDHTTNSSNMMMVNGAPTPDVNVWKQTVSVTPNTNYAFSTWIQALYTPNPAILQFSINGTNLGNLITASLPTCTWSQFYTTWNSGNLTSAVISIVNKNTEVQGNDFALDDISFAPVYLKKDSVIINIEKPLVLTNKDTTACVGTKIQINTSGASSYTWSPTTSLSDPEIGNPVLTIIQSDDYIVTGTTTNGCLAKDTIKISAIPLPLFTKSNDTAICKNSTVQLNASGGATYSWSPSSSLNNPNVYNPLATPLANTTYYVTATNASGCSSKDSVKVIVNNILNLTTSPDTAVCKNTTAQLFASGASSYSWTPAGALNNPNIPNPIATPDTTTSYFVTGINSSGCSGKDSIKVVVNNLPSITVSNDTVICKNDSIKILAGGGLNYLWQPASSLNNSAISNPIAKPIITTTYYVTVTNSSGCAKKDSIKIIVNDLPVIKKINDTAICINTSLQLSASGGVAYSWSPNSLLNNPNIPNPIATLPGNTNFKVNVTNAAGCNKKDSIKISAIPLPSISLTNDTSICVGTPIQLSANGGSVYLWLPTSTLNNSSISNPIATPISSTTYKVTVTNSSGCLNTDSVKILTFALPVISKSSDTTICKNIPLQIFAKGGSSYLWTPATGLSNSSINNPIATPLNTTTYLVTVSNNAGCLKKDSIKISLFPEALVSVSNDTLICRNTFIQLNASGGILYSWAPASTLDNANVSNPVATPITSTKYFVSIRDVNGCKYKDSTTVNIVPASNFSISSDITICKNKTVRMYASGGDSYLWEPNDVITDPEISNPFAKPFTTTVFTVKIKENKCNDSALLSTIITVRPSPNITATKTNDIDCSNGFSQLNATGGISYLWTPANSLNTSNIPNPVATPNVTTSYIVTGKDNNGCENADTITVVADISATTSLYLMPSSFSPNGDGINDCFGPKFWGRIEKFDFNIYNRYGQKVFSTQNPSVCWDGKYNHEEQGSDVFVYTIIAKTACGLVNIKGIVTLIK